MSQPFPAHAHSADSVVIEPRIFDLLEGKRLRRDTGPYQPLSDATVAERMNTLLHKTNTRDTRLLRVRRLAGGASKEQFACTLATPVGEEVVVLRLDPLESIVETCRLREAEAIRALDGRVPVAKVKFVDVDGSQLGQPGIVTSFVHGVTKPPADDKTRISGVGTEFGAAWRQKLAPQFIDNWAQIHSFEWRNAQLPSFQAPLDFPEQAALWQVNWWAKVWKDDKVDSYPAITYAEQWMRENLPRCTEPVFLHGDYRTGNFMFDPVTGAMTAVLDWELCHIGDFHEDLGWALQPLFVSKDENGDDLSCYIMSRAELLDAYQARTGRVVDLKTLRFYEVLSAYKVATMNLGTGLGIAMRGNGHQDSLLAYLSSIGHTVIDHICLLIEKDPTA